MPKHLPPKTRQQIAAEYGFHPRTLARRLKKLGIDVPDYDLLTPRDQKAIYCCLGYPSGLIADDYEEISVPDGLE